MPMRPAPPSLRKSLLAALVGLALACLPCAAQAPLDVRIALVIGNAAYRNLPALSNAGNDARSMSSVLKKLGFTVVDVIDGSSADMARAITQMQAQIKGRGAVAMLYYAGHGLQLDWHNYMVPVDAKLAQATDVPRQTVDIEQVIDAFKKSGTRMNIIVLDACRDNPFSGTLGSKGLAPIDAPPGTYLAFATAPGNVAEDGDADTGNGLYTQYLLKELQRPARIEDMFKRVRLQVRQKSLGQQIPWDSTSLEDDFAFNDGKKFTFNPDDLAREARAAKEKEERLKREAEQASAREKQIALEREQEKQRLAEAARIQEQQARAKAEAEARERERRLALAAEQERQKAAAAAKALEIARADEAKRQKDLELAKAQAAEEEQRKRLSAEAARERQFAEEKAEWDKIKDSKNAQDYYAYLLRYPNGVIAQQATFALEALDRAKITAQADKSGQVQRLGEPRFRVGDKWTTVVKSDYNGQVIGTINGQVDRIENGRVYIKGNGEESIRTLDGGVITIHSLDDHYAYDPPRPDMPGGEISVGKKWTSVTRQTNKNGTFERTEEIRIVAHEQITIGAGTFWAYKFEMRGWVGRVRFEQTYWMEPNWGVRLKVIRKIYYPRTTTLESQEVVSFTRGERVAVANETMLARREKP